MPIEKILIEFAKSQLQLVAANELIASLRAQIEELNKKPEEQKQ